MDKIKELYNKNREIILYILFGVMTTLVGWSVKFTVLGIWKIAFRIPADDVSSSTYLIGFYLAMILHWVAAVLFAFFTNRKWVFTEADKSTPVIVQLGKFAGGRVVTFLIELFGNALALSAIGKLIPVMTTIVFLWWNLAEIVVTVCLAVVVLIGNYIFSKMFVFKNKK